ncbi:polysaccharide deacetylase family protein [Clostridium putrefaciens]|uniref:Polysaccharide deacetylase family protein n=1 Tax=Clostridium putrefaciens TaxID=99675 RepID=A0A381JC60_9CLOT|nr:polysaccharide deacetylase family protein [Clostridium putrefaciens]SUY47972.1 polysaccharide deacetylase family protein [Clostridium putrefaciens]
MKKQSKIIIALALILICSIFCGSLILKVRNNDNISKNNKVNATNNSKEEEQGKVKENNQKHNVNEKKAEKLENRFEGMELKDNLVGVPILYYHSVEKSEDNELRISPKKFRGQLKYLKDNNYVSLTLQELQSYITQNKPIPKNSVVITFDDGYKDNYDNAYPILKEFGYTATIFVISGLIDKDPNYLNSDHIKEMSKNGVEIGSHSINHDNLLEISKEDKIETITKSKQDLEKLIEKPVISIAYPFGKFNDDIVNITKDAGYTLGFTIDKGWGNGKEDPLKLSRVYISAFITDESFKERISKSQYK